VDWIRIAKPLLLVGISLQAESSGFGGFSRTDYRSAKRPVRSAGGMLGPTAAPLIVYQNLGSVADCILSQW
jgi:hypothetical protein